jgi:spore coat polysaccharide biosynthesis protein SpsF
MRRVIIVQARMTSRRLPGKILLDLAGRPLLAQELRRLKRCRRADDIVVATTDRVTDDPVVALAETEGVRWFRGSEDDVLGRYLGAADDAKAEVVVRVTADCPLIDPEQTDRVIAELCAREGHCDYAANVIERTLPRGLDAEALFMDTLLRTNRLAHSAAAREHVTWFIREERPDLFTRWSVRDSEDHSDLRWTVDTFEDLTAVRRIYADLGLTDTHRPYRDIVAHVLANRDIVTINGHVRQQGA